MWLEECDSFAELCRGYLPYYLLIVLPIFIIISPANPVAASHEFPVYRMHQYDLHGVPHGNHTQNKEIITKIIQLLRKGNNSSYHIKEFYKLFLTTIPALFLLIFYHRGSINTNHRLI